MKQANYTVSEAARLKGISPKAIYAAIAGGRLEAIEIPAISYRIAPEALDAFTPSLIRQQCGNSTQRSVRARQACGRRKVATK